MLTNISIGIVLKISFLFLSNVDVKFAELEKLIWGTYTTAETLPTTSRIERIDKREIAKVALDANLDTFVVHMLVLEATESSIIYCSRAAQIATL